MFHKVHLRLTLLFSVVTSLILLGMSVLFLLFYSRNLRDNAKVNFENDINAFSVDFETSTAVSYNWLMSIQENYSYDFYVYDNGVPFRFTQETKSERQLQLIKDIQEYFEQRQSGAQSVAIKTMHREFTYVSEKEKYLVGIITIPGMQSDAEVYVLYSMSELTEQMHSLIFRAIILISAAIILLFVFSWFYTKRLLMPIEDSRNRQAQFIAAASHEIRNPVNTILSALSAMEKGNDTEKKEFNLIAQNEGKRLRLLTEDLLTLARSDNQSFSVSFGEAQLDTILLECYEAFTAPAREKNIHLEIELPDKSLKADRIDGERIRQVVSILLDNAVSYTPNGGTIRLRCSETAKQYCIEVIDNGTGIGDEHKKHIFERFYRADAARENKSHFGLGLCIAKELTAMHGGTISVKDTPGGGASFSVCIPKR